MNLKKEKVLEKQEIHLLILQKKFGYRKLLQKILEAYSITILKKP